MRAFCNFATYTKWNDGYRGLFYARGRLELCGNVSALLSLFVNYGMASVIFRPQWTESCAIFRPHGRKFRLM